MGKENKKGRGYPIPPKRLKRVIWVNDTPHLSTQGAADHLKMLKLGDISYGAYARELNKLLQLLLTNDSHRAYNDYYCRLAVQKGSVAIRREIERAFSEGNAVQYMLDKLEEEKLEAVADPILGPTYDQDLIRLKQALDATPDGPLKQYELKLFLKYAGDSSTRTGEGYYNQIKNNYLKTRPTWVNKKAPDISRYERTYRLYRQVTALNGCYDGHLNIEALRGYLDRARKTTFGGYPYLRNMGDFTSDDENDPTTYVDWYNKLSIAWLYLTPNDKLAVNADFIALERVQPGGYGNMTPEYELEDKHNNKQRFVQAQSAMISHAVKLIVDALNIHHKTTRPTMYADKNGEDAVTVEMKRIASVAFGTNPRSEEATSVAYNVIGTDYTNFDADQDITISNDVHYNNWRFLCPAWFTKFVIDPYVKATYRDNRILVPRLGLIQTTGVKSGMADTNQTDTDNCGFADIYELVYYSDKHEFLTNDQIITLVHFTMCNGDDRYKLSYCDADDIEKADDELGYIAQKQKQEIFVIGSKVKDFNITYLKTILVFYNGRFVRTDAISKLILARIHPETRPLIAKPASTVMDFFMSASRSSESPNLYIYVDYMYERLPMFKQLVDGEIDFQYLIDHMVAEQMEEMKQVKGKRWMRRKGMDYDAVIEKMNTKYGYGDEGYRGSEGALKTESTVSGLQALPQVKAIMALSYERKVNGTLGEVFRG